MSARALSAMAIVRVATALLLGIHGYYRALSGGVVPFGGYLDAQGFPAGLALAWAITLFEMTGPLLLIANKLVRPVALGHMLILTSGVAMIHGRAGWFVVGGGRNGVEFSVLLLCCLVAILWQDAADRTPASGSPGA